MIVASQYRIKTPRVLVNIHVDYKALISFINLEGSCTQNC